MRTKRADPSRKRPAGPTPEPVEESPSVASASPDPPAESGPSSEPVREAEPAAPPAPPKRRWRAPRAENWERREGIRATLLLHLPTRRERATYRRMGQVLYDASLARGEEASETPADFAFRQLEALLSEVRFLEGFAGDVVDLHDLDEEETVARLGRLARAVRNRLSRLADGLAHTLDAEANRPDFTAPGA